METTKCLFVGMCRHSEDNVFVQVLQDQTLSCRLNSCRQTSGTNLILCISLSVATVLAKTPVGDSTGGSVLHANLKLKPQDNRSRIWEDEIWTHSFYTAATNVSPNHVNIRVKPIKFVRIKTDSWIEHFFEISQREATENREKCLLLSPN